MTASYFFDMCKQLKELTAVELVRTDLMMTKDNLLKFVQDAEKLQEFAFYNFNVSDVDEEEMIIDVDTFKKLVSIVEGRSEKTQFCLVGDAFYAAADLPEELITAASNLITLHITKY